MHIIVVVAAVAAAVALVAIAARRLRARSDERLKWQATRQRDWTVDELDDLSRHDTGEVAEVVVSGPL